MIWTQLAAVLIMIGTFLLISLEKYPRAYVAMVGAGLMVILGIVPSAEVLSAIHLDVLCTVIGAMIMTEALSRTGLFSSLARVLVKSSKGNVYVLHALLVTAAYVLSIFTNNIAATLIMIPITVEALGELAVDPDITMMTEAIVVDIGGIALPISSIPNIMVSIEGGLGVRDFVLEVAPASFMLYVACLLISMRHLARAVKPGVHPARRRPEGKVASSSPLSLESLKYVAAFLIGIVLLVAYDELGLTLPVAALIAGGIALLVSGEPPKLLKEIDWPTVFFLSGIFIVVRGAENAGLLAAMSALVGRAAGGSVQATAFIILWFSALASAAIDNIPLTATLIPVIKRLSPELVKHTTWWSLVLGANLGGNLTAIGSPSNIITLGLAERYGRPITFMRFTRYGVKHTLVYLALCMVYLYVETLIL